MCNSLNVNVTIVLLSLWVQLQLRMNYVCSYRNTGKANTKIITVGYFMDFGVYIKN